MKKIILLTLLSISLFGSQLYKNVEESLQKSLTKKEYKNYHSLFKKFSKEKNQSVENFNLFFSKQKPGYRIILEDTSKKQKTPAPGGVLFKGTNFVSCFLNSDCLNGKIISEKEFILNNPIPLDEIQEISLNYSENKSRIISKKDLNSFLSEDFINDRGFISVSYKFKDYLFEIPLTNKNEKMKPIGTSSYVKDNKYIIKLFYFSPETVSDFYLKLVEAKNLKEENKINKIVLDLKDCDGGGLESSLIAALPFWKDSNISLSGGLFYLKKNSKTKFKYTLNDVLEKGMDSLGYDKNETDSLRKQEKMKDALKLFQLNKDDVEVKVGKGTSGGGEIFAGILQREGYKIKGKKTAKYNYIKVEYYASDKKEEDELTITDSNWYKVIPTVGKFYFEKNKSLVKEVK